MPASDIDPRVFELMIETGLAVREGDGEGAESIILTPEGEEHLRRLENHEKFTPAGRRFQDSLGPLVTAPWWEKLKSVVRRLRKKPAWQELAEIGDTMTPEEREQFGPHASAQAKHPLSAAAGAFADDPQWDEFQESVNDSRRAIDEDHQG